MKTDKNTLVDKIWIRIKNNKFLAIIIVLSVIIAGIATLSDNISSIFKKVDDLIPDQQKTDVIDSKSLISDQQQKDKPDTKNSFPDQQQKKKIGSKSLISGTSFDNYINTNIEIAESEESDIVNLSKDGIIIDFSINNIESNLQYTIKIKEDKIIISPFSYFLTLLKKGGPIMPIHYWNSPSRFQLPTLDFKIVNNSDITIFFTKAVFSITESKPDQFPVILIRNSHGMNLPISNIGWGKVYNCKLFFNLVTSDVPTNYKNGYKYELSLGDFEDYPNITYLGNYFQKLGVKTDIIRKTYFDRHDKKYLDALGPFKDGYSKIFGEIHYEGENASGIIVKEKVLFEGSISFGGPRLGASMPPTFVYDVTLSANKESYLKEVPLSQAIKPNESDRFNITISAPQSSRHLLTLTLFYNDNQKFTIPNISLNYFMTKLDTLFLTQNKIEEFKL